MRATDMTDFATFIEQMPGLTDDARRIYLMIDAEAARVGAGLATSRDPADLRERTGSPWLVEHCRELADALDTDPRLAAIGPLRAWAAGPDGIGNTWINWYVALLKAHIEYNAMQPMSAEAAE
jgi:hypothetical protein